MATRKMKSAHWTETAQLESLNDEQSRESNKSGSLANLFFYLFSFAGDLERATTNIRKRKKMSKRPS